jgi:hypothetical protein
MKDWNSIEIDRYYDKINISNNTAIGILDISRDISSELVKKRSFDMTYFYINRMIKMGLVNYVGFHDKVEHILEEAIKKKKKYCMIACQGLMLFRGPSLIIQSLKYAKKNPNFFVIGHIMDKANQHYLTKGAYPGLHRQYLFVNLTTWQQLGKPSFDEMGLFWDRKPKLQNYELSEQTIHSNYTPAWIKGGTGIKTYTVTSDGSNWIDIACKNNIIIDNLDSDMRACKVFLYPYCDTDKLEKVWYNKQSPIVDELTNQSQRAWIRKLAYQEKIEKNRVYAFNTETLLHEGARSSKPIDVLFSAAAGFKPLSILNANGFHNTTEVHYFDWCKASLDYRKDLLKTWNGVDFHKWLLVNDLKYNFSSTYRGNYEKFWNQEVSEQGGAESFKKLWDKYSKLQHHFHLIDIVTQPDKLFDLINQYQGNKVLWTTNIWSSEMLHWNVEPEQLEQSWFKFQTLVPKDLILYGHDYQSIDLNDRIKNKIQSTHVRYESVYKR